MRKLRDRKETFRLFRFWCWLWFGHDRPIAGHDVQVCGRCGATIYGNG